ncbi:hypothetical protein BY996DRAFT_3183295 [Phakopsora pachyrhizi]|uniref:BAG domain-containing protein n=1 Tax=Phakopsora pachyrhizi TaxID=170000 RepID=A0AAV0ANA7_PHAPC|nr:hypothetical protein BY996DRAFT_3183295 [Phakopsora pachyrhizi]CAH7670452.1 hypothetical protein PPACK8108_LOCUS5163 [Phakopsora pachyrhizi]
MFSPHIYPSSRQRRLSQSPSFFDFLNQSPYNPSYNLQPEAEPYGNSPGPWGLWNQPTSSYPANRFNLPAQHSDSFDDPRAQRAQRLRQHRELELDREAQRQREQARLFHPVRNQDALRSERANRLSEARRRQKSGRTVAEEVDDDPKVEVDLPDGRTCVVPLSWAKKMQARYPNVLTDSHIRPIIPRSTLPPHPIAEPEVSLAGEPDQISDHDSDFYALDPSQAPATHILTPGSPEAESKKSKKPVQRSYTPAEVDAAARLIQQQFRLHRRLEGIRCLEKRFRDMKSTFNYPSPFELTFQVPPEGASLDKSPSTTKLAFNNSINRPVQVFEESLLQLQIDLDGIISGGNEQIKARRKQLIKEVEAELEKLDRFKSEAWLAQCALKSAKLKSSSAVIETPTVEMADSNDDSVAMEVEESHEDSNLMTNSLSGF